LTPFGIIDDGHDEGSFVDSNGQMWQSENSFFYK